MRDQAHEIRERLTDAKALCAALGCKVAPRASARSATILCPSHAENTPSCSVRVAKDGTIAVKCHACGWTADALGLIAQVEGIAEFADVLKRAAELANAPALAEPTVAERPKHETEPSISDGDYHAIWSFLLQEISPMREHAPHVAAYLLRRGVFADAEAVDVRGLPRDGRALIAKLLATFSRGALERAGILRAGRDALDWADNVLCIPWRDRFGRITAVQRRRLDEQKEKKYVWPPNRSPRVPYGADLFAKALAYHGPEAHVVIVEGALDTLARRRIARTEREPCAVVGISSASTPDVGWEPLHDLIRGRRVYVSLDADQAGDKASVEVRRALMGIARDFKRETPIGAKDWNEALSGLAR